MVRGVLLLNEKDCEGLGYFDMENGLIFENDYIVLTPKTEVKPHNHDMPHVLISEEPFEIIVDYQQYRGRVAIIRGNALHSVIKVDEKAKVLLVMPLTKLYFDLENYFTGPCLIYDEYISFSILLEMIQANSSEKKLLDERINSVILNVVGGNYLQLSIKEIAEKECLSISRLEHLFSQETGIRLKHFILINKLKSAYMVASKGENITYAALEAGFCDSAHLAYVAKKMTGISISKILK